MAGKFEVYEDHAGKYRFRLKSHNGEIVAQSQSYGSREGAHEGCEAVQRAAEGANVEDLAPSG